MRVLWVCNIMLPVIAEALHREASNKEGWLSGLLAQVAAEDDSNIELAVAFPVPMDDTEIPWKFCVELSGGNRDTEGINGAVGATLFSEGQKQERLTQEKLTQEKLTQTEQKCRTASAKKTLQRETDRYNITCYGFHEDTIHADRYQPALEPELQKITEDFQPDVVHCFGTEYPHTLAVCKTYPHKGRILLGIQGICTLCAEAYFADMPEEEIRKVTFRDLVKRDTLRNQQEKFVRRGVMEREAVSLAGNITGRTAWDKKVTGGWNPAANYYSMNETLRAGFYEGTWKPETCKPHSIFVSQGDYPLKGLHYLLKALPQIRAQFPDVQVYVAGNDLTAYQTWKQKLKISAYGRYLRRLIREGQLEDSVHFLGKLTAEQMKERFIKSHLFLCCSSLENSPNSLGEAMLLGVPCVSTEVGGIPSLFTGGTDGLWCAGHKLASEDKNNACNSNAEMNVELENIVNSLTKSVIEMWSNPEKLLEYSKNAREHARKTHDKEKNFAKLQEIYAKIAKSTSGTENNGNAEDDVDTKNTGNARNTENARKTGNTRNTRNTRNIEGVVTDK